MKKRYVFLIILFIIIATFTVSYMSINADSGWDTSYDSGSSWSSSDWGSSDSWSSSDWDYGSNRSYSSHNGSSEDAVAGIIVFFVIIIIIIILSANKNNKYTQSALSDKSYYEPDYSTEDVLEKIKKAIPGFEEKGFLNSAYQNFLNVQNAWTNFDFDKLRELLTDELFNTYNSQLKVLKAKKQKNIMDGFHLNNHRIAAFRSTDNEFTIKTYLNVAFYDYVVDKNEQVVRGNKYRKVVMTYELTFIRTTSQKENKCPNCNAPLPKGASNICDYCHSIITTGSYNWVLSKKQAINQNWER